MNARIEALHLVQTALWRELSRGASERDHAWHVLSLATVEGERACARSVVLREAAAERHELIFYCDARSSKVAQMRARPLGTLLAWSPLMQWQLRLEVSLRVVESGLEVSSRWARVKLSPSAQDFLSPLPPGSPVDRYSPERATRDHFAVVTAEVSAVDWLELHADGHRRARFDANGARWLAP